MASLTKRPSGGWMIQVAYPDRRRGTLYIGQATKEAAQAVRSHVTHLERGKFLGQPVPPETWAWLSRVDARLHRRIAKLGLCEPRERRRCKLAEVLDAYLARLQVTEAHFAAATAKGAAGEGEESPEVPNIARTEGEQMPHIDLKKAEQLPPRGGIHKPESSEKEVEALKALHRRLHSSTSAGRSRLVERIRRLARPLRTIGRFRPGESAQAVHQFHNSRRTK